jgi:hypothetical protein
VLAAAALLAAGGVAARSQATTPGAVYVIKVLWTDTSSLIAPDPFRPKRTAPVSAHGADPVRSRQPGLTTRRLRRLGADTALVEPGGHGTILINWND